MLGVVFKVVVSGVLEIFLFICWTCAVRLVMWFISWLRMVLSMVLLFVEIVCAVWSEVSIGVGLLLLSVDGDAVFGCRRVAVDLVS